MSIQSSQVCIENDQNKMDSMLILCQLHREIRGRRDKKIMRLLASQFVQSLLSGHNADCENSRAKSLVKKANELLVNVQHENYSLSITMTGHLLDSLAHGIRHTEHKGNGRYLQ
ncbi:hypothetical protein [Sporomusa aerivorans]|uniref:hypothetical protein n=1 Tax=Sporomusa aerivorans TaxID=204936 RepID=UPI00352B9393